MVATVTSPPESRFRARGRVSQAPRRRRTRPRRRRGGRRRGRDRPGERGDRPRGRGADRAARRVGRTWPRASARSSGVPRRRCAPGSTASGRALPKRAALSEGAPERDPDEEIDPARRRSGVAGRTAPIALAGSSRAAGSRARAPSGARSRRAPPPGSAPRAVIAIAHQYVCANAVASGSASALAGAVGDRAERRAAAAAPLSCAAIWRCSTTASIAVPSDPPTRWSTLSIGVARGTCVAARSSRTPPPSPASS